MGLSLPHILILAVVVVLLLGGGRFSSLMGDVAKGIKNFKKGMAEDESGSTRPPPRIETKSAADLEAERERDRERIHDERP